MQPINNNRQIKINLSEVVSDHVNNLASMSSTRFSVSVLLHFVLLVRFCYAQRRIGIVGLPRTGSTALYNIVRLIVEDDDPNTLAGWHDDFIVPNMRLSEVLSAPNLSFSIVYKAHYISSQMVNVTDTFFLSIREAVSNVCSLWRMFGNESSSLIPQCQELLSLRTALYYNLSNSAYCEVEYEQIYSSSLLPVVFSKISRVLNITQSTVQRLHSIERFKKLKPPDGNLLLRRYHPVTLLHPNHRDTGQDARSCLNLLPASSQHSDCTSWFSSSLRETKHHCKSGPILKV